MLFLTADFPTPEELGFFFLDEDGNRHSGADLDAAYPFCISPNGKTFYYPRREKDHQERIEWLADQGITEYVAYSAGAYCFKHEVHAAMYRLRWPEWFVRA